MRENVRKYVREHEITTFLLMTFVFSWILWAILYGSYIGIINRVIYERGTLLIVCIGGFMPSTIAVIITGFIYRKEGIKRLLKGIIKWRVNPLFYFYVIFFWMGIFYSSAVIDTLLGYKNKFSLATNPYYIIGLYIFITFLGGPLGEELGWRGFLLPRLQNKTNPFCASIIIGFIWTFWHWPLFFIPGTAQHEIPFILFLLEFVCFATLITWVYNKTNGSLLLTILFHAALNTSTGVINNFANFVLIHKYIIGLLLIIVISYFAVDMFNGDCKKVKFTPESNR